MQNLLDQMSTAIILLDMKGRFSYLNQAAEQCLNITARNLLGKRYSYFVDANSLPVREWLQELVKAESKLFDHRLIELKNGQRFAADLSLQKVDYQNQSHLLIEWQNSQLLQRHKQDHEWQRNQAIQRQLLQNLAHEIKTPLSGIAGAAQLLEMESHDPNSPKSTISQIVSKEVKRLSDLVDRMLLGQKVASRIDTNIHEIIEQVISFISLNLSKSISIKRDYDPSLPEIQAAPEQIYQVLLNLAQNAIEALSHAKTVDGEIQFKTRVSKDHPLVNYQSQQVLKIEIIDNGPGISEELQPNIFFPMISGKNSSGLGLGIAQSLIQQHQGLIEFSSNPGKTLFNCYLPLKARVYG
ncbi:nitrogen regulation protein NR(II) [Kangiella sp. TOML190]|uniref:nitrogen regulation protein NR(II) n=1 Tax=Kangiella sp. TOML190 TaxID=2931351 RepID=UPI0020414CF0|nr:nitrogen regulation protein NR(II) [Kangiella sp. TOML190]